MFRAWIAAAAGCVLFATAPPAWAQSAQRAWVSGHGTDRAGCGAPTAPCRSFQYAHDNIVAAGGEIDVLDPAGYGAVTISKAISIVNDGAGTAGLQSSAGTAITISAGAGDKVLLRGLDIEGQGSGVGGVMFSSGASLTLEDSSISGFTNFGLLFDPSAQSNLFISNSRFTSDGLLGVDVRPLSPPATGSMFVTLEHIEAVDNTVGLEVNATSAATGTGINVALADSLVATNGADGVEVQSGPGGGTPFVTISRSTISHNQTALSAIQGGVINVAHSTLSGNATVFASTGGSLGSFGDNAVSGNTNLGDAPSSLALQ